MSQIEHVINDDPTIVVLLARILLWNKKKQQANSCVRRPRLTSMGLETQLEVWGSLKDLMLPITSVWNHTVINAEPLRIQEVIATCNATTPTHIRFKAVVDVQPFIVEHKQYVTTSYRPFLLSLYNSTRRCALSKYRFNLLTIPIFFCNTNHLWEILYYSYHGQSVTEHANSCLHRFDVFASIILQTAISRHKVSFQVRNISCFHFRC